jgi:hypothetical protein
MEKEKKKSKYMKIKVKAETGETIKVVDADNFDAPDMELPGLGPQQLEQMSQGLGKFKCVGVVLHSHSSPG